MQVIMAEQVSLVFHDKMIDGTAKGTPLDPQK